MSETDKNNLQNNDIKDTFGNDDDLWDSQSTEAGNQPNYDFEEKEDLETMMDDNPEDKEEEKEIVAPSIIQEKSNNEESITPSSEESTPEIETLSEEDNQETVQEIIEDNLSSETEKVNKSLDIIDGNKDEVENLEEELSNSEQDTLTDKEDAGDLHSQKETLIHEIQSLLVQKNQLIQEQQETTKNISILVQESLKVLEEKKQNLEIAVQKLEHRKERIEKEMRTTFSGVSQDLAIRVQGFKDYLVGSLQDLAIAAEQLDLNTNNNMDSWETNNNPQPVVSNSTDNLNPQFVEKSFQEETRIIRSLIDQYRTRPDYYGPSWQLRRTFEPIHAERVSNWFFTQGGRGALKGMTSRLQNILIASAIISILSQLYGDRLRVLILSDTPEKLGEWRRGLQDCLGISRGDFGPSRGVVLFETAEALSQKADRIMDERDLPLVIMDQNEDRVNLSLLQFPLWLAFAPEKPMASYDYF
ncbi:DUF3086 domain-containing protein [Cyanobacterium stanieri LEGE 03274]|uniref:DUF3086 domain-containing protein n=1 Tax=Cyanobacterium stanieri LEGE 03274 TaxID=1828756 RepID=A0ABR9V6J3_9CHRO|nr:DUF3086 domain-containing protein [Cyanobacterium stanieri]MBE9223507.1 DUF3086 domain-containing protein [Cyanobacterium stanieri LEGE 03274]